jgi:hypothetical protein
MQKRTLVREPCGSIRNGKYGNLLADYLSYPIEILRKLVQLDCRESSQRSWNFAVSSSVCIKQTNPQLGPRDPEWTYELATPGQQTPNRKAVPIRTSNLGPDACLVPGCLNALCFLADNRALAALAPHPPETRLSGFPGGELWMVGEM